MKKLLLKIIYKIFNKIPEDINDDGKVDITDEVLVMNKILEDKNGKV